MPVNMVRRRVFRDPTDDLFVKIEATKTRRENRIHSAHTEVLITGISDIEEFFGKMPEPPYVVEYRVRQTGKYMIDEDDCIPAIAVYHEGLTLDEKGSFPESVETLAVCFLLPEMRGKRVDRIVVREAK